MKRLFLDMDGVVADFDKYAYNTLGLIPSNGMYTPEVWQRLADNPRMYRDLPKTYYADKLVHTCRKFCRENNFELYFLTAVPKGNDIHWAFFDKVNWAQLYFNDIPVHFGPFSKDKHTHCKPGDILIDDRKSNIEEWKNAGGVAIHHTNFEDTVIDLYECSSHG
jgi:5'-nucleotidase